MVRRSCLSSPLPAGLALAAPLLLAAATATCEPDYACGVVGHEDLFSARIAPLLEADRPRSCNQCHLSGIDLSIWQQEDACQTMACMIESRVVDVEQPERSLILAWIDRAKPASDGITADVVAEEREAVLSWIEHTASCGDCLPVPGQPACTRRPPPSACKDYDPDDFVDPGDCSDHTLEQLFMNDFFGDRGRCFPCHFENDELVPEAPKFIHEGECNLAALRTLRALEAEGYLDASHPDQSLWLTKPLDEELGGTPHGGDAKYHALDEPSYLAAVRFTRRWAACLGPTN